MHAQFKTSSFAILGLLAIAAQAATIASIHIKGGLIDSLAKGQYLWETVLLLVIGYAILQVLGSFANIFSENLGRLFSIEEYKRHWIRWTPKHLNRSDLGHHHKLFNGLYNNVPKLFSLKVSILLQSLTAIIYFGFFLWRTVHDEFWIALSFIPIIGCLSWGAGRLYCKTYEQGTRRVSDQRVGLMSWLDSWFRAYRERSLNWPSDGTLNRHDTWFQSQGLKVAGGLRFHAMTVLKRDIFGTFLVDWPYILCVVTVLICVARGQLTIGEFLIWTALIDYLMSAFGSLRFIKKCRIDTKALSDLIQTDLAWLKTTRTSHDAELLSLPHARPLAAGGKEDFTFQLLSGETTHLGTRPGFYRIHGSNGSGKSTLLDTLLGFNESFTRWSPEDVARLRTAVEGRARVVERDGTIFAEFNSSLYAQIFGLDSIDQAEAKAKLEERLDALLPEAIAGFWKAKLNDLELIWGLRPGNFSSGEKVVLSFFRALAYWDASTEVLVVDECDSVLDQRTASVFQASLMSLSQKVAVWYVSHIYQESKPRAPVLPKAQQAHSLVSTAYLMGYSREQDVGFVTPVHVAALAGGSGAIKASGNIGPHLVEVFDVVLRALVHTNENYRVLYRYDWHIDSVYQNAEVGEAKSAGLALAAAVIGITRMMVGLPPKEGVAATGHVLLDGSVVPVKYVDAKVSAAQKLGFLKDIISFQEVKSLIELEARFQ